MAIPAESAEAPRWQHRFESARHFAQDLDRIATAFDTPDTVSAWRKTSERAVDYAFQRLLMAFRLNDMLAFPLAVTAAPLDGPIAHYTLAGQGQYDRNVALTIAGDPEADATLVNALKAKRHDVTDFVVFWDPDGVAGVASPSGPHLEENGSMIAKLADLPKSGLHFVTPRQARLFAMSDQEKRVSLDSSYATDYVGWIENQAALLQVTVIPGLDCIDIAEELGDLGRSEKHAIQNHLRNLLMHMLKWRYQPDHRAGSWQGTIRNARMQICRKLNDSPSLKPDMPVWFANEYADARKLASDETGLPLATFPESPPFTLEQALDQEFLPEGE